MLKHQEELQEESARRFDAATMQRVIEVATRLQQAHRETVTAEQIEEIGKEVGLDPEFVRRALDVVEADVTTGQTTETVTPARRILQKKRMRQQKRRIARIEPLHGFDIVRSVAPGLLYGVYAAMAFAMANRDDTLVPFLGLLQPLALSAITGWAVKGRRRGAIAGSSYGLGAFIAVLLTARGGRVEEIAGFMLLLTAVSTGIGVGSAAVRQWRDEWQELKLKAEDEEAEMSLPPTATPFAARD